jgi:predicted nucleotide-binding protein
LVGQINDIRGGTKKVVEDPQFDNLVPVAVAQYIPSHAITSVTITAKQLFSYIDGILSTYSTPKAVELQQSQGQGGNVFIGHGRNEVVRHKVKDFIRGLCGLNPLVLQELPSAGMTVIEKLEKYGRTADYAVLILTADDVTAEGETRARQNVIQELGWFQGVLGRNRTVILCQKDVELFSNIGGVVYLEFTGNEVESVFEELRKELEEAGLL